MSGTTSAATGSRYGIERVCAAWEYPRPTYCAQAARQAEATARAPGKRGPKPEIDDATLLEKIRADLANSPFTGKAIAGSTHGCVMSRDCASAVRGTVG